MPCPQKQNPIQIQEVNAINIAYRCPIRILVYDREPIETNAVFMSAPTDLLGMDIIPQIYSAWLPLKKNKMLQVNLAEVKIEPILLPEKPSFTKQYPLKGGHDEMTACITQSGWLRNQMAPIDSLWTLEKLMGFHLQCLVIYQMHKTYFIEYKKEHTHGLYWWTYLLCSLPYCCILNLEK
jgi:hypothetical protein